MANKNKIEELEKQVEEHAESIEECLNELNRISDKTKTLMQENEYLQKENEKLKNTLKDIDKKLELALDVEQTDAEESFYLLYEIQDIISEAIGE